MQKITIKYIKREIVKLKYLYKVNEVIRYNLPRKEKYQTQSVAEHITNMIFLAYYFRPYEDPENKIDFEKIIQIILMHDLAEIETGDVINVKKQISDNHKESQAMKKVLLNSPKTLQSKIKQAFSEYENLKTREGQFVKAIDKIEGQIFWVEKKGVEMIKHVLKKNKLKLKIEQPKIFEKNRQIMEKYNFPIIQQFLEVINQEKEKLGMYKSKRPANRNTSKYSN